jgi:glycosyltransferase involved in cell wall biosynthesis
MLDVPLSSKTFTVSVVIPLFNKERSIRRTIDSVLRQSRRPEELIVVDDGSSDRSAEIALETLSRGGDGLRWRVVSQQNSGVSLARNRGAEEATSHFIAFLDADDEWLPAYLEEIERLAGAHPEATVLTVRLAKPGRKGQLLPEPSALPPGFFGMLARPLDLYRRGYGIISSSSVVIRRDAWERSGGFPAGVRSGEDMFWWLHLCMAEKFAHSAAMLSVWHVEDSGFEHRRGEVPHHLAYFLGTDEGRRKLRDRDLARFIATNLISQIGGRRVAGDQRVARELWRLSRALPFPLGFKCWAVAAAPRWSLKTGLAVRNRWRHLYHSLRKAARTRKARLGQ